MSGELLRPEGVGILLLIQQLDFAHTKAIVIEIELFGGIDVVADLDVSVDIGGGDFIERSLKPNRGVVIDDPFMADEKDFIQLLSGEPSDEDSAYGAVIAVDGSLPDAGV
jgi:hypothetical protein